MLYLRKTTVRRMDFIDGDPIEDKNNLPEGVEAEYFLLKEIDFDSNIEDLEQDVEIEDPEEAPELEERPIEVDIEEKPKVASKPLKSLKKHTAKCICGHKAIEHIVEGKTLGRCIKNKCECKEYEEGL